MSRNSEKAQSMLYRHHEQQAIEQGGIVGRERRPRNVSTVTSVPLCEKWRSQVIKEINRKINKIQDVSLSDFQIRDLNDEINKLQREKRAWEHHLKSLGGPNYLLIGQTSIDIMGNELPSARGYKYYGRARNLPGVKELFEAHASVMREREINLKTAVRPPRDLSARYYGFIDDDEYLLEEEKKHTQKYFEEQISITNVSEVSVDSPLEPLYKHIPTPKEVEEELIKRRRQKIAEDYLG